MNDESAAPIPPPPVPAKKRGCFFYGCLTSIILMVVLLVGILVVAKFVLNRFNQYIAQYTETNSVALPTVQFSADELKAVVDKVTEFSDALDAHTKAAPLVLTGPQVNALLEARPELAQYKGQFFVSFDSNQTKAQVSLPLDKIKVPGLNTKGRYLNGSGTFSVSINDGLLEVNLTSLEVKGKSLPPEVLTSFQHQNLATNANKGPNTNYFNQIESLEVTNSTLVIRAKTN